MNQNDLLFEEKNVFSPSMVKRGIAVLPSEDEKQGKVRNEGAGSDRYAVVAPLDFGATYLGRFAAKPASFRAIAVTEDPTKLPAGAETTAPLSDRLPFYEGAPEGACDFLYTPTAPGQFLVVETGGGADTAFELWRYPILLGHDTDDDWYRPGPQRDLKGTPESWGNWEWTADEVIEHIYEPLRAANPDYITRRTIGKDATGTYDMWCYTFTPPKPEQTMIITGGMHASEMDGYLALARFFELLVGEDGTHPGLHYLRTRVKIVLVPIINVYSASVGHVRRNANNIDLNRDFGDHSQAETRNVVRVCQEYKDEASALIDYHTSSLKGVDLYYQFSIDAPNARLCFRVVNHIYEDLKRRGLVSADPVSISRIPGALTKQDKYLQGYTWNHLGIPTLVVEHEDRNYAEQHSALGVELAVEYYGNFMIQTALAKLKTY